jgi:hypothetical protein
MPIMVVIIFMMPVVVVVIMVFFRVNHNRRWNNDNTSVTAVMMVMMDGPDVYFQLRSLHWGCTCLCGMRKFGNSNRHGTQYDERYYYMFHSCCL